MNVKRTVKLSFLLLAVMIFMMAMYGFAAANTVPASNAGDGSGAVTGYTISNIHYVLNATTPSLVNQITFTISPAIPSAPVAGSVYITVAGDVDPLAPALDFSTSCTIGGAGTVVTCDLSASNVPVVDIETLRVIAAQ